MGAPPTGRKPGRPAKPAERKRRTGNPGKRALAAPADVAVLPSAGTTPDPPRPLGAPGRALWDRAWRAGMTWISADTDIDLLLMVCEQIDERVALRVKVLREGDWRDRAALRAVDAQVMAGLSVLGFTPSDRARMGVGEVGQLDELEEFRRRSQARRSGT